MDSVKVLMVDDEARMRKLVKDFLMKEYLPHVSEYEAKGANVRRRGAYFPLRPRQYFQPGPYAP